MLPGSIQPVGCLRVDLYRARGRGHPLARPGTVDFLCLAVKFPNSHKHCLGQSRPCWMPSYCESNTHWILMKAKIFTTEFRQLFQSCTEFAVGGEAGRDRNWRLFQVQLNCFHFTPMSETALPGLGIGGCLCPKLPLSLQRMCHMNDSFILYSSSSLSFPKPSKPLSTIASSSLSFFSVIHQSFQQN